jgi:chromosome segregation ATPase
MTNAEIARKIWEKAEWSYLQDLIVAALDAKDQLALGILEEVESLSKQLAAKDAEIAGWKRNWASDGRTIDSLWKQLTDAKRLIAAQQDAIHVAQEQRVNVLCDKLCDVEQELADAKIMYEREIAALHSHAACLAAIREAKRATWEKAIQVANMSASLPSAVAAMGRVMEEDLAS